MKTQKNRKIFSIFAGLCLLLTPFCQVIGQTLNRVAVHVNEGVILESEINEMIRILQLQGSHNIKSSELKQQVTEHLILKHIQLQWAQRYNLTIGDLELDNILKKVATKNVQKVNSQQEISPQQIEDYIKSEAKKLEMTLAEYREYMREKVLIQQVQMASMQRRIQISPQEINQLIELLEEHGMKNTQYHIGHILIAAPDKNSDSQISRAKAKANKIYKSLQNGADFKQTAIQFSQGAKALNGGDWGYLSANQMPNIFADQIKLHKKGEVLKPIRGDLGFHIVKIFDIQGQNEVFIQEVRARQILLKTSPILSEEKAKEMLQGFIKDIKKDPEAFSRLAQRYSDDKISGMQGGDLGWATPDTYVPEFTKQINNLNIGQLSKPFKSSFGWHIVQVLERKRTDAKQRTNVQRARQIIFNRKLHESLELWLNQIRNEAYIRSVKPMEQR